MVIRAPQTIDEYISRFPPEVGKVLVRLRDTVRSVAPGAMEKISYGMATFWLGRHVIHFGAFKNHIGIYPPVREPEFADRIAPYRSEKGNLRFPLDQPIPYDLVADIVKARVAQPLASKTAKRTGTPIVS